MVTAAKNNDYSGLKTIRFTLDFHTINKRHIELDLNYVKLIIFEKKLSLCFRTSICRIHCIDQFKTFTLLLKYKTIDFETLSHIHVYSIAYVSYRQGLYRIRIDTADDRIIPALVRIAFIFSSPEHKVLRVSYCDQPLSVVVRRSSCVAHKLFSSAEYKVLRLSYCDRSLSVVRRCPSCVVRKLFT